MEEIEKEITNENPAISRELCRLYALTADTVKIFYEKFESKTPNSTWKAPLKSVNIHRLFESHPNWLTNYSFVNFVHEYYMAKSLKIIRSCVETSDCSYVNVPSSKLGEWFTCLSPVRLDLAGGWYFLSILCFICIYNFRTDTPPICYSHGGKVVNVSVLLDGKRPIGARARCVEEKCIRLSGKDRENMVFRFLHSFLMYKRVSSVGNLGIVIFKRLR